MDTAGIIKKIIVIILLFLGVNTYAQKAAAIEKALCADFEKIDYWSEHYSALEIVNVRFKENLFSALNDIPETLDHDFTCLQDHVGITSSPDKNLRAYSWNTRMGGTMRDFQTIFQYKGSDSSVKAKLMTGDIGDEETGVFFCLDIFSFENKGETIYIAVLFMTGSSKDHAVWARFLAIEGDKLNDTLPLIETEEGLRNELWIDYNSYREDGSKLPEKLIDFDPVNKTLKFARIDENNEVTNEFDTYKFNGTHFVRE